MKPQKIDECPKHGPDCFGDCRQMLDGYYGQKTHIVDGEVFLVEDWTQIHVQDNHIEIMTKRSYSFNYPINF